MNKLLQKMLDAGSVTGASVMSESVYFTEKDMVSSELPILNIAFSGEVNGGFTPGLTVISGESKTFKSMISLYCLKAYLDKYKDAIGILYDTEYGITLDSLRALGIDPSRILHVPVEHIEQLKFDFVKKLDEIKRGDKVFFLVDSIGQISSKKETDDAADEKSVADMTRAKSLRSLLRLITLQLVKKDLPCFMVNHVYMEIGAMFAKTIIPGGTAVTYSSNTVFVITKSQEKDGTELTGWNFNIGVHKSRFVKEKSRLPIRVMYEEGIKKYSGILDLALESGEVIKPSNGWFQLVDKETGELIGQKTRAKDTETEAFLGVVLKRASFQEWIKNKFKLGAMQGLHDAEEELAEEALED
jgi:RecA/RadA recombinase